MLSQHGISAATPVGQFQESFGSVVALPAVTEKGYFDARLSVASPGGHSSIPPKHTVGTSVLCPWPYLTCYLEYRSFGCLHYQNRSQSHPRQAIQKYPILNPAQRGPNNTLHVGNVFYDTLLCSAVHSAEIDQALKKAILDSTTSDDALKVVESAIFRDPLINSLVGTTRAVDIVGGGVKA